MAASGVKVADDISHEFNEMKLNRIKHKFIIYKIENDTKIVTDSLGPADCTFAEFTSHLPANDCRYCIYDCQYETKDGRPNNRLVFIAWAPDSSKVKSKMVYASSKDALTTVLVGVMVKITATDMSELTEQIVKEKCSQFN